VFASPSYTPVNLKKGRADTPPAPCYPDICFAVDHEDQAFDSMVCGWPQATARASLREVHWDAF